MKEFIKRWRTEPKFKAKVELGFYGIFIVLVTIFAYGTVPQNIANQHNNYNNEINEENIDETKTIKIPKKYNYTKKITVNDNEYQYKGTIESDKESIIKTINDESIEYLYQNKDYYKKEQETFILTTKDEVYDIIDYSYLDINTINKYLSKSESSKGKYLIYLKDIILNHSSDDYITIEIKEETVNIDYTTLMKHYDESIEKCLIEIVIEEIE